MSPANSSPKTLILDNLTGLTAEAVGAADDLLSKASRSVRARVNEEGKVSVALLEQDQFAAHGLTTV